MGNKAQRYGITARKPIGSADLNRLWQVYDSKKRGKLTKEEARKFLKDLALAADAEWDGSKADELISMCSAEDGCLDYDRFENLLFSFAEHGRVDLSRSIQHRHDIKKKDRSVSSPPRAISVSTPEAHAVRSDRADTIFAPLPPPKPKAGDARAAPAAFEIPGPPTPASHRPHEAVEYDPMPPLKMPAAGGTDLTASRFEPMPARLGED